MGEAFNNKAKTLKKAEAEKQKLANERGKKIAAELEEKLATSEKMLAGKDEEVEGLLQDLDTCNNEREAFNNKAKTLKKAEAEKQKLANERRKKIAAELEEKLATSEKMLAEKDDTLHKCEADL